MRFRFKSHIQIQIPRGSIFAVTGGLQPRPLIGLTKGGRFWSFKLQPSKCKGLWLSGVAVPPELAKWADSVGLRIETEASILLGSPVGRKPAAIEACLRSEYKTHDSLFTLLQHDQFPLQAAYLLGRISGVPKINHNLRSVHPRFMSNIWPTSLMNGSGVS